MKGLGGKKESDKFEEFHLVWLKNLKSGGRVAKIGGRVTDKIREVR